MLLAHPELLEFVHRGCITGVTEGLINAASIDLTLGNTFLRERSPMWANQTVTIDLAQRDSIQWYDPRTLGEDEYIDLRPGEFILTHTVQKFYMPDDMSAEYSLKSSLARNGLGHMLAGWIDPGFTGSVLTLELYNVSRHHTLRLRPGMPVGQIKVFKHTKVSAAMSYRSRGRYNGDHSASGIKQ
jgi:dCTP deaminase